MHVTRYEDAAAWADVARDYLEAHPARCNLIYGIARRYLDREVDEHAVLACVVDDSGEVAAAAVRTPGRKLLLGPIGDVAAAAAIAESIFERVPGLPAVYGAEGPARAFRDRWLELHGGAIGAESGDEEKLYALRQVDAPPDGPGAMRRARRDDCERLVSFALGFRREAEIADTSTSARENVVAKIAAGHLWVWDCEGRPVSMAAETGHTPLSTRITYVYTPPERRGCGHASRLVAALSRRILEDDRVAVLYTDASNPTSNKIYRAIGYEWIEDMVEWRF